MKSLITGGSGFIASHIKRLIGGEAPDRDEFDLTNLKQVKEYVNKIKPDYIFHLAAAATQGGHRGGREVFDVNVVGTYNLLEALDDINYKAFINVGSSSEYGIVDHPMNENDLPKPEFMYAATKVATTMICRAWAHEHNKPIATVRPFSVYGPGESDKRFIPTVIRCALKGETLNLAPGVHDWVHVEDVAKAMVELTKHDLKGQVVNLGTGKQRTNDDVVSTISIMLDTAIKTREADFMRFWDVTRSWVSDTTESDKLGLKFRSLEEGLVDTIDYYKRA